jgi:hypothetical protein
LPDGLAKGVNRPGPIIRDERRTDEIRRRMAKIALSRSRLSRWSLAHLPNGLRQ